MVLCYGITFHRMIITYCSIGELLYRQKSCEQFMYSLLSTSANSAIKAQLIPTVDIRPVLRDLDLSQSLNSFCN